MKTHQFLYPILIAAIAALAIFGTGCKKSVMGVALSEKTASIFVDEWAYLQYHITPHGANNYHVSWMSRDNNIAIVNNDGIVRGIAAGATYVVVTTEEGGFKDSCLVTVSAKAPYGKRLLPSEIIGTNDDYPVSYQYTYDEHNRLTEILKYENDAFFRKTTITYNMSGQITEIEETDATGNAHHVVFTYIYNYMTAFHIEKNERYVYEFDDDGLYKHLYYEEPGKKNRVASFEYNRQGNCSPIIYFINEEKDYVSIPYDKKNGISSCINTPSWFLLMWGIGEKLSCHHVNNAVSMQDIAYQDFFSYVYNENDYPSEMSTSRSYYPIDYKKSTTTVPAKTLVPQASTRVHYTIKYIEAKSLTPKNTNS